MAASPVAEATAPALPDDAWLQMSLLRSRITYRIANDGRYLVIKRDADPEQRKPVCKFEPGIGKVSDAGTTRLRVALDGAGFFGLDPTVETGPLPDSLRNNEEIVLQPIVVTARSADGDVHSVRVVGGTAAPVTLGPLESVLVALDYEAIGNWLGE